MMYKTSLVYPRYHNQGNLLVFKILTTMRTLNWENKFTQASLKLEKVQNTQQNLSLWIETNLSSAWPLQIYLYRTKNSLICRSWLKMSQKYKKVKSMKLIKTRKKSKIMLLNKYNFKFLFKNLNNNILCKYHFKIKINLSKFQFNIYNNNNQKAHR